MKKVFIAALILTVVSVQFAWAQDRIELGIGAGKSTPMGPSDFSDPAANGDSHNYWLGYGLDDHWGIELGFDAFDFDDVNLSMESVNAMGVYRFNPLLSSLFPFVKLGASSVQTKDATDDKLQSLGGKLSVGFQYDFKYVSVGALYSLHQISKITRDVGAVSGLKNAQASTQVLFAALHYDFPEEAVQSEPTAPAAPAAPVIGRTDGDNDGVFDDDDKCPNTPAGVVVNQIGCSEKEKASVKIQIEFASGQSVIDAKYSTEVKNLADFMKKFPETKVEIAGHSDSMGSAVKNTSLSQSRADAVKAALVAEGVSADRLTAKGYGPAQPVADNKTKEGRQQNRRVMAEISIETDKKK